MVFEPTLRLMAPDVLAEATTVPLTVIVEKLPEAVGVTVSEVVPLVTDAVYELVPAAKLGDNVPAEMVSVLRFLAVLAGVRVRVIV